MFDEYVPLLCLIFFFPVNYWLCCDHWRVRIFWSKQILAKPPPIWGASKLLVWMADIFDVPNTDSFFFFLVEHGWNWVLHQCAWVVMQIYTIYLLQMNVFRREISMLFLQIFKPSLQRESRCLISLNFKIQ